MLTQSTLVFKCKRQVSILAQPDETVFEAAGVDAIQVITGCTLGKGNIEKAGWGKLGLRLIAKKKEKAVRVSYKPGRHKMIAESAFMRKRGQGIPPTHIPEEEARSASGKAPPVVRRLGPGR